MDLEECVLITDNTLCYLAAGCPRLSKLSLSHCELITSHLPALKVHAYFAPMTPPPSAGGGGEYIYIGSKFRQIYQRDLQLTGSVRRKQPSCAFSPMYIRRRSRNTFWMALLHSV
ncbi:hypothetical protein JTE90_013805 [Oedothorax gibbosus]|uniref:Uncharacterized protein n=1 Tax=Oedothorax gibbosus TaxID=931172 RepID=A0AAV6VHR4_9ARAC|nr:hypothetical protein JTE90_013805 [Oedothorax gibbosus]